jgi:hypothetical protein
MGRRGVRTKSGKGSNPSDEDLVGAIFEAGFSTRAQSDALAGRGICGCNGTRTARVRRAGLFAPAAGDANDKDSRERLCRYILRPPLANDRLSILDDGDVRLDFKRPWSNGGGRARSARGAGAGRVGPNPAGAPHR